MGERARLLHEGWPWHGQAQEASPLADPFPGAV